MKQKGPLNGIFIGVIAVLILVIFSLSIHLKKVNKLCEKEAREKIRVEEKLSQAEKETSQLKSQVGMLKNSKMFLEKQNAEKDRIIKDLNSQIASLQEEIKKLNRLKDSLEESLKNALTNSSSR